MHDVSDPALRDRIIAELEVVDPDTFDAASETERRIDFLADYLVRTNTRGYVLGISGGVDSTVAGRLAQLACERVRARGGQATFVAMRLPYRTQADADDATAAVDFIRPDEDMVVNIGESVDALWDASVDAGLPTGNPWDDFVKGNVKARLRMVAQYAVAGARGMLVIGTDQAAEAVVGFYTKFGDGACDITPLTGLTKRRVKEIGRYLGASGHLVDKVPTADLEDDKPMQADEEALGVRYEAVDDYLEGRPVTPAEEDVITGWYLRTQHKRHLPVTPGTDVDAWGR
jgi:NAD+ synthase